MAYIEWKIEKTEINYAELEATYTGTTKKGNKTYTDVVKYSLTNAMLQSFLDPNMQKWQAFKDAVNELTGVTDWVVDTTNQRIQYINGGGGNDCKNFGYTWKSGAKIYTCPIDVFFDQSICLTNTNAKNCRVNELWADQWHTIKVSDVPEDSPPTNIYLEVGFEYNGITTQNYLSVTRFEKIPEVEDQTVYVQFSEVVQKIVSNVLSSNEGISLLAEAYINEVAKSFVTPIFDDSIVPKEVPDFVCSIDEGFLDYPKMARDKYTYMFDTLEFDALMQTIIEQRSQRQCEYLQLKKYLLDIDHAEGDALDVIGRYLGQPRALINFIVDPYFGFKGALQAEAFNIGTWYTLNAASRGSIRVLDDELYRNVIKARIIKNNSSNSRDDLIAVLKLLGAKNFKLDYKRHGVISVRISNRDDPNGLVAYYISKYLDENSIIPRQLGYRIGISVEKEVYMTSLIYPVYAVEGFESSYNLDQMVLSGFKNTVEDVFTSYNLESITERLPTNQTEFSETFDSNYSIESINITKQVEYKAMDGGLEAFNNSYSIESINITKQVSYLSTTVEPDSFSTGYSLETVQITN